MDFFCHFHLIWFYLQNISSDPSSSFHLHGQQPTPKHHYPSPDQSSYLVFPLLSLTILVHFPQTIKRYLIISLSYLTPQYLPITPWIKYKFLTIVTKALHNWTPDYLSGTFHAQCVPRTFCSSFSLLNLPIFGSTSGVLNLLFSFCLSTHQPHPSFSSFELQLLCHVPRETFANHSI